MARSTCRRRPPRVYVLALSSRWRMEGCAHDSTGIRIELQTDRPPLWEASGQSSGRAFVCAGQIGQRYRERNEESRGRKGADPAVLRMGGERGERNFSSSSGG